MAVKQVRALQRGLEVLRALNRNNAGTALELARMVGLPRPTVYRLLETLEEMGLVIRSPSDETWRLTLMVRSLSDGYNDEAWVREIALPAVNALHQTLIWPIDVTTFERDAMVVRETTHRISPFSIDRGMVGTRLPLLATASGRTYLAFCPDTERDAILERLSRSDNAENAIVREPETLARLLSDIRAAGYGSRIGDFRPGTASISVPVRWDNRVLACLTVIWISSAMPQATAVQRFLGPMQETARAIETAFRASTAPLPAR